jgi:hypothetical protein
VDRRYVPDVDDYFLLQFCYLILHFCVFQSLAAAKRSLSESGSSAGRPKIDSSPSSFDISKSTIDFDTPRNSSRIVVLTQSTVTNEVEGPGADTETPSARGVKHSYSEIAESEIEGTDSNASLAKRGKYSKTQSRPPTSQVSLLQQVQNQQSNVVRSNADASLPDSRMSTRGQSRQNAKGSVTFAEVPTAPSASGSYQQSKSRRTVYGVSPNGIHDLPSVISPIGLQFDNNDARAANKAPVNGAVPTSSKNSTAAPIVYPFFGKNSYAPKIIALRCLEYLDGPSLYNMSVVNSLWCQAALDDALWESL